MPGKDRTRAYVSGSPFTGYVLHIPERMPRLTVVEFGRFHGTEFCRYRAAQAMANAINADAKTQK